MRPVLYKPATVAKNKLMSILYNTIYCSQFFKKDKKIFYIKIATDFMI